MPRLRHAGLAVAFLAGIASPAGPTSATTESATGMWDRVDGLGGVRIAPCGGALCGHVVWLRDRAGPASIGQRVLYGMRRSAANTWTGSAVNPADGQTYAGTMTLEGSRLLTRGCALGGLVCQSVWLTRAR